MLIAIIFLVIIVFALAIPLALVVVIGQRRAANQARKMLESGNFDRKKARKLLKSLRNMRSNDGQYLYNELQRRLIEKPD